MMYVYVYCVITWHAHQCQAPSVVHAWWSNTYRYLHILCISIKINMLTTIIRFLYKPNDVFYVNSCIIKNFYYFHYHHNNILYQNIITVKIAREHTWHRHVTLSLRLTTQAASVRGGQFSDFPQVIRFTHSMKYKSSYTQKYSVNERIVIYKCNGQGHLLRMWYLLRKTNGYHYTIIRSTKRFGTYGEHLLRILSLLRRTHAVQL